MSDFTTNGGDGGREATLARLEAELAAHDAPVDLAAALDTAEGSAGAEGAEWQDATETPRPGRSGARLADLLTAQGEGDLAERVGPAMLESADAGFREFKGPDLEHVRDVADAVGATEGLVVTAARLNDLAEAGTWSTPDLDPAANEWLGGDGGLTDAAKAWFKSDDPVAAGFRQKHGGGAAGERVLARVMALAFDRAVIDPGLRSAIANAGWKDELSALNALAEVAGQLKTRRS